MIYLKKNISKFKKNNGKEKNLVPDEKNKEEEQL